MTVSRRRSRRLGDSLIVRVPCGDAALRATAERAGGTVAEDPANSGVAGRSRSGDRRGVDPCRDRGARAGGAALGGAGRSRPSATAAARYVLSAAVCAVYARKCTGVSTKSCSAGPDHRLRGGGRWSTPIAARGAGGLGLNVGPARSACKRPIRSTSVPRRRAVLAALLGPVLQWRLVVPRADRARVCAGAGRRSHGPSAVVPPPCRRSGSTWARPGVGPTMLDTLHSVSGRVGAHQRGEPARRPRRPGRGRGHAERTGFYVVWSGSPATLALAGGGRRPASSF